MFAKSCVSVPAGSTDAGTAPERADNFGATALLASTGTADKVGLIAGTLGRDMGAWTVRGLTGVAPVAHSALNVVLLALWPRDIGDSTLYTPEQLENPGREQHQFLRNRQGSRLIPSTRVCGGDINTVRLCS